MSSSPQDRKAKAAAAAPKANGSRVVIVAVVTVLVLALAMIGATWAYRSSQSSVDQAARSATTPPNANADKTGIIIDNGKAKADAMKLDLYFDYQCPICKQFEDVFGGEIEKMAAAGTALVTYRDMTFLDNNLRNDSSARAGNAAACADVVGAYKGYHDAIFANQPATEGQGYTDDQLLNTFAKDAGITGDKLTTFQQCVKDGSMKNFVTGTDAAASKAGVTGTPTLKVNGTTVPLQRFAGVTSAQFPALMEQIAKDPKAATPAASPAASR